ncbi:hypothetical protein C0Q70_10111 [Pomacea canaliculata]|uniref:Uncharacterized protein n=1 Tax=Pomacea canaliculata TaxID=400727 RepID=A0A2T7PBP8_POMCA|nr:hypothetical protein C0Q70_10111 [Pomacea canaliculata]
MVRADSQSNNSVDYEATNSPTECKHFQQQDGISKRMPTAPQYEELEEHPGGVNLPPGKNIVGEPPLYQNRFVAAP